MKILLDTCVFISLNLDLPLSKFAHQVLNDEGNELYLSVVSVWEMSVKYTLGKLGFQAAPDVLIPRTREANGIGSLPLTEEDCLYEDRLPLIHRDPFDRMLVAQALARGMAILTPDEHIARYPVRVIW